MNDNNFANLYKLWTTDKLLDIVDEPADYQPLAVEAARLELDSRHLTTEQIEIAKAIQADRQKQNADKRQKVKVVENTFKSVGSSLVDTFNPIQSASPSTDKYIKFISLFLGGLFLYSLYFQFGLLQFMFAEERKWDFSTMLIFLPWIVLPSAGLLLWFRKKPGWILAAIFFSYTASGAVESFVREFNRKPLGIPALDNLLPATSPTVYIGSFLLFGGLTWVLCKQEIREIYKITKQEMLIAIGIGAGIVLLIMYVY